VSLPRVAPLALLLGAAVASAGSACPGSGGGCRTNAECGFYRTCHVASGTCRCVDNRGCGEGEFCNGSFQCQVIAGCTDNADCEATPGGASLVCDVRSGQCASADECRDDSQCPLGTVCDPFTMACLPGCRDEADCPLGRGCLRLSPGDVLGRCLQGSCSTTEQCAVGSNCDLATHTCVPDTRGPFCGACQFFSPLDPQCGDPANYCLVDTGDPSRRSHYCGVDCALGQACPHGYECKNVIIFGPPATPACVTEECAQGHCSLTGASCQNAVDCPKGPPGGDCPRARDGVCAGTLGDPCATDQDCGGSPGSCLLAQCRLRESAAYGVCSCVVDSDCPADDCRGADLSDPQNPLTGHCLLSGHACYGALDCDVIACVGGGCLIGSNCKPAADRRCADLQPTGSP
jgi:hypothetical protein